MPVVCDAQVMEVRERNEQIKEFILKPGKYIGFEAGQFLQLTLEHVTASDYWPESRTFSIASYLSKDKIIRLIIKKVGIYTTRIFNELLPGKYCTIKYAYGDFTLPVYDEENEIVYIAGGTGIAPCLAYIDALKELGQLDRLRLLYSVKCRQDIIDPERLKNSISQDKYKLFLTREENQDAICRRIEVDDILTHSPKDRDRHYYICGSKEFTIRFKKLLENEGMPSIHIDKWY
jgi:ferredoxin-NADP reductase